MEFSHLAMQWKRLGSAEQTRRAALRRLSLGGISAGLLTAASARSGHAQAWDDLSPAVESAPVAPPMPPTPVAGVASGVSPFVFPLEASAPTQYPAGAIRWATRAQFPALHGVAMLSLHVETAGLRELHWHLNAHELNVCLAGQGRIGIFAPDGSSETIEIRPGSITFIPNGYTHFIQNTGADDLHLVTAFTHEQPETTDLSQALPSVPTPLLAQTFGVPANGFPFLASRGDRVLVTLSEQGSSDAVATPTAAAPSQFSVNADALSVVTFAGGTVQPLNAQQIPRLEGITVFPLSAVPHGLREPHWHPNAAELNYCVSGRAQIGVVAPDGSVQTFPVEAGDIAFIPQNWFHYIANISDEPLQFLIFFITADPRVQTINLSQTFDNVPAPVLAASFDSDAAPFAALPKRGNVGIAPPVED